MLTRKLSKSCYRGKEKFKFSSWPKRNRSKGRISGGSKGVTQTFKTGKKREDPIYLFPVLGGERARAVLRHRPEAGWGALTNS